MSKISPNQIRMLREAIANNGAVCGHLGTVRALQAKGLVDTALMITVAGRKAAR